MPRIHFSYILMLNLLLTGCTSAPVLDEKRIRPWSKAISSEEPGERPAIATCKKGKYELHYLAARHTNTLSDDTIQLVKTLFNEFNFDALIIEGIPHSSGESPQWFVEFAKRELNEKENYIKGGEGALAAIYADQRKLPFYAGEPERMDIYNGLKSKGYSDLDYIGFVTIRQIPQWVREKEKIQGLLARNIPPFIATYCKTAGIINCPTYNDVLSWYEKKNGHKLVATISNEEAAPLAEGPLFTQKISYDVNLIRDYFTLKVIQKLLQKHYRVAVVYGASHFIILRKSFEDFFGSCALKYLETKT